MYRIVVLFRKEFDSPFKLIDEDFWKKDCIVPPERRADEMLRAACNEKPQAWEHSKDGRPVTRKAGKFQVSIQDIDPQPEQPEPIQLSLFSD